MRSEHHNRLNIRDTSQEPSNLHGDRNLPSNRISRANGMPESANEDSDDLNDRAALPSDLPGLEEAHVPHAQRQERALRNKAQAKARADRHNNGAQAESRNN